MAVYTGVPGVIAYAIKDGVPIVAQLAGLSAPHYPTGAADRPAGARTAAGVRARLRSRRGPRARAPRRAAPQPPIRARPTDVTVLAVLPALALVASLIEHRRRTDRRPRHVQRGPVCGARRRRGRGAQVPRAGAAMAGSAVLPRGVRRAEDPPVARRAGCGSRPIPSDLANMVVNQIDEALHPEMVAILVSGVEEDG